MLRSVLAVALVSAVVARADIESGPKAGEKVAELKAFGVVGKIEGKEADFAKERADLPTVYLFVNAEKFSRPMNQFIKTLDGKLPDTAAKAGAVAVFLTTDTDKYKEYLPKVQMSVKYENTAMAVLGDTSGPKGWGINPDAHLTAVVVGADGKVAKSFAFESVNGTDVKAIEEALKKAAEKKK